MEEGMCRRDIFALRVCVDVTSLHLEAKYSPIVSVRFLFI